MNEHDIWTLFIVVVGLYTTVVVGLAGLLRIERERAKDWQAFGSEAHDLASQTITFMQNYLKERP